MTYIWRIYSYIEERLQEIVISYAKQLYYDSDHLASRYVLSLVNERVYRLNFSIKDRVTLRVDLRLKDDFR